MNVFHPAADRSMAERDHIVPPLTPRHAYAMVENGTGAPATRWKVAIILLPLLLYVAALNPFFLPGVYDDVVYYSGAVSLAAEGSIKFEGYHITDWPPGVSVLLAIPFSLGLQSMWAAKLCILFCAAAGLILAWRLFERERREHPTATLALFALLPCSFMMGTRVMSEWPYFLASIAFLLALHGLREEERRLGPAVLAGVLLGMAALTKFTGVLLGAAIIAQMIARLRRPAAVGPDRSLCGWEAPPGQWRRILPELMAAGIGGSCFLLWKAKLHWQIQAGTAADYEYYRGGLMPELVGRFDPLAIPGKITDLLFHSEAALGALGWQGWLAGVLCAVPGVVVLIGMFIRLRSTGRTPADWYVLSLLVLLSTTGDNQQTRYLMPVAPFLIGYGMIGGGRLWRWMGRRESLHLALAPQVAAALWLVLLLGAGLQLLWVGNLSGTHRGLSYLVSPTPAAFYRGFWLELYQASEHIRNDPLPGGVAVIGDEDRYVTAFTGRERVEFEPGEEFVFLLALRGAEPTGGQIDELNLGLVHRSRSVALYRKGAVPPGDPGTGDDQRS